MNELWALPFDMAEQVLAELALAKTKPQALVEGFPERKARGYELVGGVAVIPVSGAIVREQGWYGTGQDAVSSALKAALADPSARAILLDINSPGGVVAGTKELADAIAEARTKKRCAAYANGLCASAAYWLASATGTVYAPLTATVGSIGVIMTITNYAKLEEKWGISTVTITGGKWKAAGQGGELTDEERRYFQERINTLHQIFKADVGRHMGLTADPQLWGEAQLLLAQPARELGLVTDIVRDRDAAIRKLAVEAQMTREELAAQSPELVDALLAEGRLKAEAENKANMDKAAADAVPDCLRAAELDRLQQGQSQKRRRRGQWRQVMHGRPSSASFNWFLKVFGNTAAVPVWALCALTAALHGCGSSGALTSVPPAPMTPGAIITEAWAYEENGRWEQVEGEWIHLPANEGAELLLWIEHAEGICR